MVVQKGWPEPNKLTKIIGVLFAALYVLMLAYVIAFWVTTGQPRVAMLLTVITGLAVGVAYSVRRVHPMARIVPSVLWVVLVGFSPVSPWRGDSTQGGAVQLLCAAVLICALAYHVYVDVKVLVARSGSEGGDSY